MAAPRITVVGSANLDLILRCDRIPRPGETLLGAEVHEAPGGKGANQAVAAARLGAETRMIGRVGDDGFGERLLANLRREGVDHGAVIATPDVASGLATISVEASGENAILVMPGANERLTPADIEAAADAIRSADVLLTQLETPIETIAAAIEVAREAGVVAVLDPAPAPAAPLPELLGASLICPNESEASALLDIDVDPSPEGGVSAARKLLELGPQTAVITLGAAGAAWATRDGATGHAAPPAVEAVDTTAAGDAFAGAMGYQLAGGASLDGAIRFAVAAGALAATRLGAQPSMPTLAEVEQRLR